MKRISWIVAGAVAVGLIGGGSGVAIATGQQDDGGTERPITGAALDKAEAAALKHTGEGRVTATEFGDEEGAYEVEITRPDGRQVDVHLDDKFSVLSTAADTGDHTGSR